MLEMRPHGQPDGEVSDRPILGETARMKDKMNHPPVKKAIWYRDCWLAPGSHAYELHMAGKMNELAAHMREVDRQFKAEFGSTQKATPCQSR